MKHFYPLIITFVALALTSCESLLDGGVDISPDGYNTGVTVSFPAGGYYNPLYWGNDYYPGVGYYPAVAGVYPGPVRPAAPNWGHITATPVRPGVTVNGASGNIRPAGTTPAKPSNSVLPAPGTKIPVINGEPGIVMPPEGSGLRPVRK